MNRPGPLRLFEAFGVELEYMIVDGRTLDVLPAADQIFRHVAGRFVSDVEQGPITWSNELALHVVELKLTEPERSLTMLPGLFDENVRRINEILAPLGGRLMPGAMHPWMDPTRQTRLWPHECGEIYAALDRVFDCRGHGWVNLQSVHLNLPFCGDEEFGRLHAAIRLLLPIMPALAASSPVVEGRVGPLLDARLDVYRNNAASIPSITGRVIPEPVYTRADYQREILDRIYADVAPRDPDGTLRHEWLNARGAIARFDRGSIEIRVLDVQECPRADLAVCAAVVGALRALVAQQWSELPRQQAFPTERLEQILLATMRDADRAVVRDAGYLRRFGFPAEGACTAGELWRHLVETTCLVSGKAEAAWGEPLGVILQRGPLAQRIARSLGAVASPEMLRDLYGALCRCLAEGSMFAGWD